VPDGMTAIDPDYAWAEMVKHCVLPVGFVGLLIAVEVAAYTSTLSTLINWGGSFVVNDIYRPLAPNASVRREIWVSRLTTLFLFLAASIVAVLFVKKMIGWFMFINAAMVIFLLPLAVFRFFWWRFNVWGELAAVVLGLPISIFVWFILDFQNEAKYPMWQGLGLLFVLAFVVLTAVTLLTPAESPETLERFYRRCRPPGFWRPVRKSLAGESIEIPATGGLLVNSVLGILACLGLVLTTNAIFVADWSTIAIYLAAAVGFGGALIVRVLKSPTAASEPVPNCAPVQTLT
jgi:solute:Na+ symporter, SSS family